MKKISILLSTIICATAMTQILAAPLNYHSEVFKGKGYMANALGWYKTDITVINTSQNVIYMTVQGTPVFRQLYPGDHGHIEENSYMGETMVTLLDPNQDQFFNQPICRLGIVTVRGYPGNYEEKYDRDLCEHVD